MYECIVLMMKDRKERVEGEGTFRAECVMMASQKKGKPRVNADLMLGTPKPGTTKSNVGYIGQGRSFLTTTPLSSL